jgi:membrane-bound ClpP family serine protease
MILWLTIAIMIALLISGAIIYIIIEYEAPFSILSFVFIICMIVIFACVYKSVHIKDGENRIKTYNGVYELVPDKRLLQEKINKIIDKEIKRLEAE